MNSSQNQVKKLASPELIDKLRVMLKSDNIPLKLQEIPHWVCWRGEYRGDNPKLSKVPVDPKTGKNASSTQPDTWGTVDQALAHFGRSPSLCGMGFVLTPPFVGIDLDHCIDPETGSMEPWAKTILADLNTYCEVSPSGTGVKAFCLGDIPEAGGKRGDLEIYKSGRFFTVTGCRLDGYPDGPQEVSADVLLPLWLRVKPPKTEQKSERERTSGDLPDDNQLIMKARAAQNGSKFSSLFDGDTTAYPSHSDADAALVGLLAFWTQEEVQIDRIFRRSGLYRDKWDAKNGDGTYGSRTISAILARGGDRWEPGNGKPSINTHLDVVSCLPETEDWEPTIKKWPKLSAKALRGIAGDFVALACEKSEADCSAVLATFLDRFACEVGTGPHFCVGDTRHEPRINVVIVGDTSKARKGTSASPNTRLFKQDKPSNEGPCSHIFARVSPGPLSSGEGLIYAVRDQVVVTEYDKKTKTYEEVVKDQGVEDKRLWVIDEEFGSALSSTKREGNTLSTIIRCAWDSGNLDPLTKNTKIKATGAHINIVTHITLNELRTKLQSVENFNGFSNRFLWVCAKRQKVVAFPEPMDEGRLSIIRTRLLEILWLCKNIKRMAFSEEAKILWASRYPMLSADHDGMAGAVINRAEAQVIRLACIYALLDASETITEHHLDAALEFWDYCEKSAEYIFSGFESDPISTKILTTLDEGEIEFTNLYGLFKNNASKQQIEDAVNSLIRKGKACVVSVPTGKRPKRVLKKHSYELNEVNEVLKTGESDELKSITSLTSYTSLGSEKNSIIQEPLNDGLEYEGEI